VTQHKLAAVRCRAFLNFARKRFRQPHKQRLLRIGVQQYDVKSSLDDAAGFFVDDEQRLVVFVGSLALRLRPLDAHEQRSRHFVLFAQIVGSQARGEKALDVDLA